MEKSQITITNSRRGPTTIDIEGMIGVPEEWQFDEPAQRVATYEKFQKTLAAISKIRTGEITIDIRSTGGDVGDALLIYDALKGLDATITTRCYGYVASAATIIAQAASEGRREISANSLYLIHNATAGCEGNADDHRQSQEMLTKIDERLAAIYSERSGRPAEEFRALMAENAGTGRWLSPEEAIAAGLADKVTGPIEQPHNAATSWQQDAEVEKLQHKIVALESENKQLKARATQVQITEDPPLTESRRSANENAYQRDVESFLR